MKRVAMSDIAFMRQALLHAAPMRLQNRVHHAPEPRLPDAFGGGVDGHDAVGGERISVLADLFPLCVLNFDGPAGAAGHGQKGHPGAAGHGAGGHGTKTSAHAGGGHHR